MQLSTMNMLIAILQGGAALKVYDLLGKDTVQLLENML